MGIQKKIRRNERKTKAYQLSSAIKTFYATHPVSKWQRKNVDEIRAIFADKQRNLEKAHDHASSRLMEQFMEFELEYLRASNRFKELYGSNQEMPWTPRGHVLTRAVTRIKNAINRIKKYDKKEDSK